MRQEHIFVKNSNSLRCENPIGEPFFELSEVDSSNNYAMQRVQAQLSGHGTVWFAHFQNAGKGQRGKQWSAEPSQNIMMSVALKTELLNIEHQPFLNFAVALACFDLFQSYAGDNTKIKWPNDIYWKDRKAGGILIENLVQGGKWKHSIAGIGININQTLFPAYINNATSLSQITGQAFDVIQLAKELCVYLEHRWQQLQSLDRAVLQKEFNTRLYKLNHQVLFRKNQEDFSGLVKGVNDKGELLIITENKRLMAVNSIEWV